MRRSRADDPKQGDRARDRGGGGASISREGSGGPRNTRRRKLAITSLKNTRSTASRNSPAPSAPTKMGLHSKTGLHSRRIWCGLRDRSRRMSRKSPNGNTSFPAYPSGVSNVADLEIRTCVAPSRDRASDLQHNRGTRGRICGRLRRGCAGHRLADPMSIVPNSGSDQVTLVGVEARDQMLQMRLQPCPAVKAASVNQIVSPDVV